ncbi:MAG: hypothetical protein IKF49_01155 [Clostridia bacterium]|jgi:hypothetical protein|nr:hypothetical protein [Clostridia bacterium]
MKEILEAAMVLCFGISWPVAIVKSWKSRTTKGKSLVFMLFIWVGYVCGIASKLIAGNLTYVFVFYVLNIIMVTVDICLYFRNLKYDRQQI